MGRASRGDARALDELLASHLPGLRAFVRLRSGPLLRAKESASDLVQSVCLEVLQHLDRFRYRGEAGFRHWLYTTALREVLNRQKYYRAEKRDAAREVGPPPDSAGSGDATLLAQYRSICTPSREAMLREQIQIVERAFDELSEDHREVILLAHLVGLSRKEIALELGRSEGAVRNLLSRALSHLAEVLERLDPAGP